MFDSMLNLGSAFDWFTPIFSFILDFIYWPTSDFGISAYAGWDRRRVKRLLKRNGIRVWGLIYNLSGDMLMFTVQEHQAEDVYYLLEMAGVPILYTPAVV